MDLGRSTKQTQHAAKLLRDLFTDIPTDSTADIRSIIPILTSSSPTTSTPKTAISSRGLSSVSSTNIRSQKSSKGHGDQVLRHHFIQQSCSIPRDKPSKLFQRFQVSSVSTTTYCSVNTVLTRFIMTDWQEPTYSVWLSVDEISKAVSPSIHPGIVLNTTLFRKVIQATLDSMVFWIDFHQPADQNKLLFKHSQNGNVFYAVRTNSSKFPPSF
jgi:hypothetical protein